MTEDDYWERVRDMRKDDWILFDERYTPKEETPTAGERTPAMSNPTPGYTGKGKPSR